MEFYEARSVIAATPEQIWAEITDTAALTSWSSGIKRLDGTMAAGASLKLWSEVSPGRSFNLKVTQFIPHNKMTWRGGMPFGLFVGERTFVLQKHGSDTEFVMREEFSGPMMPLIWKSMPDLGPSFNMFVDGLKSRLEGE